MDITNRNHYNPCFWTAYWNRSYFISKLSNSNKHGLARKQPIYSLNIYSNSIRSTIPDDVFFEKKQCFAEINAESAKRFCKKYHPSQYDDFCKYMNEHPETVYIDFEDILQNIEKIAYNSLIEAIHIGGTSSITHKGFLSCFLIIQAMRSYEMMTSMIDLGSSIGMEKFEYFWLLKNAWGNKMILARAVTPIAFSQWTFYRTSENKFPICDSPIMIGQNSLMAILSPRLLLEMVFDSNLTDKKPIIRKNISLNKYKEFQLRVLKNTYKDIVFHDRNVLQNWQKLPEYNHRVKIINDKALREQAIHEAAERVIWAINGFNRLPTNFEQLVKPYL